jgi:hypothetical protein
LSAWAFGIVEIRKSKKVIAVIETVVFPMSTSERKLMVCRWREHKIR